MIDKHLEILLKNGWALCNKIRYKRGEVFQPVSVQGLLVQNEIFPRYFQRKLGPGPNAERGWTRMDHGSLPH